MREWVMCKICGWVGEVYTENMKNLGCPRCKNKKDKKKEK